MPSHTAQRTKRRTLHSPWKMSFPHVKREKLSFVGAAFTTYLACDPTGKHAMWLKLLRQWLERRAQIAEEHQADEHRAWQERRAAEMRKAEIDGWNW